MPHVARTPVDLAHCARFHLLATEVDPPTRTLVGPGGRTSIEPRAMQVLVTLAAAQGAVLSRDDLLATCWSGQVVGDDALTRAIAEVRRASRLVAAGGFSIETIPKTGYRLLIADAEEDPGGPVDADAAGVASGAASGHALPNGAFPGIAALSRRRVLAAAATLATGLTAAGLGYFTTRRDPRVEDLIGHARQAMRDGESDSDHQGVGFAREAVALAPGDAETWGVLALALSGVVNHAVPDLVTDALVECERAAQRALALDAEQPDALAALALLPPQFGDWSNAERRYAAVLAIDPDNIHMLLERSLLLQSVGRSREAAQVTRQATELDPLSPVAQYRLAYQLANSGQSDESEQVIERARQLWPTHPSVWYARFLLFAFNGRIEIAARALRQVQGKPYAIHPVLGRVWEAGLRALATGTPDDVAQAVNANRRIAAAFSAASVNAILALSMLGKLDDAFDVADGYLLRRGSTVGQLRTPGQPPANEQRWRKTMMLWTPVTAAMRADARFVELVKGMGMAGYWRQSGTLPDDPAVRQALGAA